MRDAANITPHFEVFFLQFVPKGIKILHSNSSEFIQLASEKREKFVKLAEGRVQGALNAIRKIGNLSNRRSYEYEEADVRKIMRALKEAVGEIERKFDPNSGPREKTFKL